VSNIVNSSEKLTRVGRNAEDKASVERGSVFEVALGCELKRSFASSKSCRIQSVLGFSSLAVS
jgi:hypothetical protein